MERNKTHRSLPTWGPVYNLMVQFVGMFRLDR